MVQPVYKSLTRSILECMEMDQVIYAEVTPPGSMGNAGGIVIYIREGGSRAFICYETSIHADEQTYLSAEAKLHGHVYSEHMGSGDATRCLDLYYGGMGNNVFVNRNMTLSAQDDFFVCHADGQEYQVIPSVYGVFRFVSAQLQKKGKG